MSELRQTRHFTVCRSLPVFPNKRTFSEFVGMSQRCHWQTCGAFRSLDSDEVFGRQASAAKAAGRSRTRNEQRLHVFAACHKGVRRLEALAHFSLFDERARNNKGVLQAFSLPECYIEKGVAEIGPFGFVPAAERWMVGIGRGDYQRI